MPTVAIADAARARRVDDADVADPRTGQARRVEGHRPAAAEGAAVDDAVLRVEPALELEAGQAHALRIVVGAPLLVEHPLHALGDQVRLGLDVDGTLARSGGIFAPDLPRPLGRGAGDGAIGEENAAVARALLQDLRVRRFGSGERWQRAGDGEE